MPSRALTGLFALLLTLATSAGVARAASWRSVAPLQRSSVPPNELVRPPRPVQLGPLRFPDTVLEPLAWSDLNGWRDDNHAEAFATFAASCRAVIAHARSSTDSRPILAALANICRKVAGAFPR